MLAISKNGLISNFTQDGLPTGKWHKGKVIVGIVGLGGAVTAAVATAGIFGVAGSLLKLASDEILLKLAFAGTGTFLASDLFLRIWKAAAKKEKDIQPQAKSEHAVPSQAKSEHAVPSQAKSEHAVPSQGTPDHFALMGNPLLRAGLKVEEEAVSSTTSSLPVHTGGQRSRRRNKQRPKKQPVTSVVENPKPNEPIHAQPQGNWTLIDMNAAMKLWNTQNPQSNASYR